MSVFVWDLFLQEACRIQQAWYETAQAVEHHPHLTAKAKAEQLVAAELARQERVTALQTRAHTHLCHAQQAAAQHLRMQAARLSRAERRAAERQLFELECCEAALEQLDQKTYLLSVVPAGLRRLEEVPGWVGSALER
jgi:hypothetical protein